ncbi:MAG: Ig-like domain-containing protein [Gemmatimonadaceae bacterium]
MRKSGFILAILLAAGCRATDGPEQQVTTSVQVSSSPTQISVGETAQASAIVKDQNGAALSGKSITWASLNQSVATVTTAGIITGVAPGNATIRGTVDGVTGSAPVTVVAVSVACDGGPITIDLSPGQVRVVNSIDSKGCIKIASTAAASSYIVIAANTNAIPDQLASYAIRSDEGETIPSNSIVANPYRLSAQLSPVPTPQPGELQAVFEANLRRIERRDLDFASGQRSYQSKLADEGVRYSVSAAAIPAVGDKTQFKVPKTCSNFTTVTATARYISTRAIIYTDDASPTGGFAASDFQDIGTEFDNLIYPTDVAYFGAPLDQDNNSRVIILYTPEVNKLTSANSVGFVGGFFFGGDLFPTTGANNCPQSNLAEIFYLLTPDPDGTINNNKRTTAQVRQGTRGTIAHEFQHMINSSVRFKSTVTTSFESIWLDEALAHFAEDLNGRTLKGLSDTGNYTFAQLITNNNDYNAFFYQNFARMRLYVSNPGPNSPTTHFADSSLADRGAAWALLRYTADHYAPGGNIQAFIKSLVPGPDTGVVNLRSRAGNVPFDTLIAGWMVANYADDAGVPNLATKYTYKTYDMRDNVRRASNPTLPAYPLDVTNITSWPFVALNLQARSASGNYFSFSRVSGGPARSFRYLRTDLTSAASFSGANFIVLRTQ